MRLFPDFICDNLPYQRTGNAILFGHSDFLSPYPCVYLANPLGILHGDFVFSNMASIIRRFFSRYPSAILWSIMTIIINTVKNVTFRRRAANISKKCQIRMSPSFANFNPTCAIIGVRMRFWIKTAYFHIHPSSVFFGLMSAASSASFTMFFHRGILAL